MDFFMPTRLFTGANCLAKHASELAALGSRCMIVTGGAAATMSGAMCGVKHALDAGNIMWGLWDRVVENPPVAACREAGQIAAQADVEFVLGVGGGSALDAAKAIAVFAANPNLDEAGFYAKEWSQDPLPIALVGTTAGTGSEVTKVSVLTDGAARKHSIHDDRLYATVAFGDSTYTHSCPPAVTLSCGVDVLAHATESYFSRKADDISRAFSVRAVRMALGPLAVAATGDKLTSEQRRQLYDASILGGLAINTTGTCFPHNVGYYLTENYGAPHGFASAIFLPAMLASVREGKTDYAKAFYDEVGTSEEDYVRAIEQCLPANDIHMTEQQIEDALPRWENNGSVLNTCVDVSVQEIRDMLCNMFVG